MEIFRKEYSPGSDMSQDVKPPQNVLSAYAFFFKETQASIKSQQPDATFESVSRIVENMWQALEENQKEKYRSDLSQLEKCSHYKFEACSIHNDNLQEDERG